MAAEREFRRVPDNFDYSEILADAIKAGSGPQVDLLKDVIIAREQQLEEVIDHLPTGGGGAAGVRGTLTAYTSATNCTVLTDDLVTLTGVEVLLDGRVPNIGDRVSVSQDSNDGGWYLDGSRPTAGAHPPIVNPSDVVVTEYDATWPKPSLAATGPVFPRSTAPVTQILPDSFFDGTGYTGLWLRTGVRSISATQVIFYNLDNLSQTAVSATITGTSVNASNIWFDGTDVYIFCFPTETGSPTGKALYAKLNTNLTWTTYTYTPFDAHANRWTTFLRYDPLNHGVWLVDTASDSLPSLGVVLRFFSFTTRTITNRWVNGTGATLANARRPLGTSNDRLTVYFAHDRIFCVNEISRSAVVEVERNVTGASPVGRAYATGTGSSYQLLGRNGTYIWGVNFGNGDRVRMYDTLSVNFDLGWLSSTIAFGNGNNFVAGAWGTFTPDYIISSILPKDDTTLLFIGMCRRTVITGNPAHNADWGPCMLQWDLSGGWSIISYEENKFMRYIKGMYNVVNTSSTTYGNDNIFASGGTEGVSPIRAFAADWVPGYYRTQVWYTVGAQAQAVVGATRFYEVPADLGVTSDRRSLSYRKVIS